MIPNIADNAAFVSADGPREGALFVGRLAAVKNPLLAVESAARAGVPLTLLGDGEMRGEVEARIAALHGAEVTMLPYDRNPWPVYARHRVLLVTSQVESFGNVLVEALAAGTPVVSVDCDFGPREIIGGAKYSHLTSRSAHQIGETLARVIERPYGRDEEAECLSIAECYAEQAVAPLIEETVKDLLG